MKYARFPVKAIKEFLKNPSEETLRLIRYACENKRGCGGCPFDKVPGTCPPPSGDCDDDDCEEGLEWYYSRSEGVTPGLGKLVLKFSEVLAIWESRKRR